MLPFGDMSNQTLDRVFQALADSTRREIIEKLEEEPRTTGWLIERFPHLSRAAVMKHIGVLEHAGLVAVEREGRHRWNSIRRDPLEDADSWLARHVERRRDMMRRLKELAEENRS